MRRQASPLELGLRVRLMLTLAAVAILPIAAVSYVIVRDGTHNVTRNAEFEVRDAARTAQARFMRLLDRRQLHAVAAAASPQLQTAIGSRDTKRLERFARRHGLLIEVGNRSYGRRLQNALSPRAQLVAHGREIGSVIAQLPADPTLLRRLSAGAAPDVRLAYVGLEGAAPAEKGRGVTVPLAQRVGVRVYLPSAVESHRRNAAYLRVAEAGLLALVAVMLLTFLLARPLLRALRWTEEQASEARIDALTGLANRRALEEILAAEISRAHPSPMSSPSFCSTSTASRRSTTPSATPPATRCCAQSAGSSRRSRARATRLRAGAARSSSSSCPRPTSREPGASPSGCGARSRRTRSAR